MYDYNILFIKLFYLNCDLKKRYYIFAIVIFYEMEYKNNNIDLNSSLLQSIHIPLLIVDDKSNIHASNKAAKELFEVEEIPKNYLLLHSENSGTLINYIKYVVDNKDSKQILSQKIYIGDVNFKIIRFTTSYLHDNLCVLELEDRNYKKDIESEYYHRLKYEEAVNQCSSALLKLKKNSVNEALKYILKGSKASRLYLFTNDVDKESGDLYMEYSEGVCAPGVPSLISYPKSHHISYKNDGYIRWQKELSKGRIIYGPIDSFPQDELELLAKDDIKYIILIPIFVHGKWYGIFEFDFCYDNVKISAFDIETLKTISSLFSIYYDILEYKNKLLATNERLSKENELLISNRKLTKDIESKNKMIYIMIHDIRNPLSSIVGFSDILVNEFEDLSPDKVNQFIKIINSSSKSLSILIENISNWMKSIKTELSPIFEKTSIKDIITESLSLVNGIALRKSVNIVDNVNEKYNIYSDSSMVFTIIQNILVNAIKFTKKGGTVFISCEKDPDYFGNILIIIEDSGVGMSPAKASQIFKDNKGESQNGTNGEKGLGIGIRICIEFIKILGGKIWANSNLGVGTTVYISLPEAK